MPCPYRKSAPSFSSPLQATALDEPLDVWLRRQQAGSNPALWAAAVIVFLLCLTSSANGQPLTKAGVAKIGKPATALVEVRQGQGSGSAFCIHPSGLFITNEHVVSGTSSVTLILDPSLKSQKVVTARVVRRDRVLDLALLRADAVGKYPGLALGSAEAVEELAELVALGFPFGKELTLEKDTYPAVSVHAGTVTSLRRKEGALHRIQMDAGVNPGCSGGPVLDMTGKVIGVVVSGVFAKGVGRTGLNFAIPVSHVNRFIARPDIQFTPPTVKASNMHEPTLFQARAISLVPTTKVITLKLIVRGEGRPHTYPMKLTDGVYRATVVPLPRPKSAEKAPAPFPYLFCTVVARQDDQELGRHGGTITIEGVSLKVLDIKAPPLEKDKQVVELPAPVSDLAVGGGGRLFVLHLPKIGKLAVFDVNTAKIRQLIPVDDDVKFAASLDKLIVVSLTKHLLERFCLYGDEPEFSAPLPMTRVKRIRTVAMGSASHGPLLIRWEADDRRPDRCSILDILTMRSWEITWRPQYGLLFQGGGTIYKGLLRDNIHVRASREGTTFALWKESSIPNGLESLTVAGKEVKSTYLHDSYGHAVPGPEGRIIHTGVGLFTTDLKTLPGSWPKGYAYIPAQQGKLTLAVPGLFGDPGGLDRLRGNLPGKKLPDKLLVFKEGIDKSIASLDGIEFPPSGKIRTLDDYNQDLTFDKRIHFLPAARLIITIPPSSDRLLLYRINLREN
jgi:S1-C subfamily serine protease